MLKFILGAILLMASSVPSFAQGDFRSGYIVTVSGDSISGLVDYRSARKNHSYCFFKAEKGTKQKRYTPTELKAYGYYFDKRYEAQNLPDKKGETHFAEVIVKGHLSLLRFNSIYYLKKDTLILLPPNTSKIVQTKGGTFLQNNNRYQGILNLSLSDCNLSGEKARYTETDFYNLTQNYNRCKGDEGFVYKAKKKKTDVSFFLYSGFDFSTLQLEGLKSDAFRESTTALIGAGVELSAPRIFDRLFFTTEFQYLNKRFQGFVHDENRYTDIFIDIKFLKTPISVRYNFLQDSNTPFIRLGIASYFDLNNYIEIIEEYVSGSTVNTTREKFKFQSKRQTGLWAGIGYTKIISSRYKLLIEGRYERANGFVGNSIISSQSPTASTSIIVGIRF